MHYYEILAWNQKCPLLIFWKKSTFEPPIIIIKVFVLALKFNGFDKKGDSWFPLYLEILSMADSHCTLRPFVLFTWKWHERTVVVASTFRVVRNRFRFYQPLVYKMGESVRAFARLLNILTKIPPPYTYPIYAFSSCICFIFLKREIKKNSDEANWRWI